MHPIRFVTKSITAAAIVACLTASSIATTLDDFPPPTLNETKWLKVDTNILPSGDARPWGSGIFDTSSGALNLRTSGVVPVFRPFEVATSGFMAVAWRPSLVDPAAFVDGSLRTKFRVDTDTDAAIDLRSDIATFTAYDFVASPTTGSFGINVFVNGQGSRLADMPGVSFAKGEDWWMEASTIGDQISMKAWRDGDPEPATPQLTLTDSTLTQGGAIGVGAGLGADNLEPVAVNATFDIVSFSVPEPKMSVMFPLVMVLGFAMRPKRILSVR